MEVISIERSTYEELLTSFNSFVAQMKGMVSPRTLQTLRDNGTLAFSQINHKVYYKPEDVKRILTVVEDRKKSQCMNLKRSAYERTDHAA